MAFAVPKSTRFRTWAVESRFVRVASILLLVFMLGYEAQAGPVKRVTTDKAQYEPGEQVAVRTVITNTTGAAINGYAQLTVRRLATQVHAESQALSLANGATTTLAFTWTSPASVTLQGYGLDIDVYSGGGVVLSHSGAVDVNTDWTKVPRYGFMSDFPATQTAAQSDSILEELAKYHVNAVQFYDWMYKHHDVLKQETGVYADTYADVAGRTLSLTTIRNQVQSARNRAMWPMAYHLAYGELTAIADPPVHPDWGQFVNPGDARPDSHPLAFWGSTIWLMNPGDTAWQNFLLAQFAEAMTEVGFRGAHIDQLGDRGTRRDTYGNIIDMTTALRNFVDTARAVVRAVDPSARVIFNTVDAWPGAQIGASSSDVSYSEVWTPSTYNDLRTLIRTLRQYAPSKQVVLPAYMNRDQANSLSAMDLPSVLLANAAIFANGAFHLELGESHCMLSTEYFPDHTPPVSETLVRKLYDYYDFIVRYENLLYENTTDVTDNIIDWTSLAEGVSKTAQAGKVWTIAASRPDEIVLHHVNLIGVDDDWRDTTTAPTIKTSYDYKYYTARPIQAVYLASPDTGNGRLQAVSFTTGRDEPYGSYVTIQGIPRLEYWNMLVLQTGASSSPPSAYSHEVHIPWLTPSVDGAIDSGYGVAIAADGLNGTNGQANSPMDLGNLYMAHDTDNVYIAFTINRDVSAGGQNWGKYIVSIDTDGVSGSGATAPAWGRAATYANPHRPDYELTMWVDFLPFEVTDVQRWRHAAGSWSNVGTISAAALDTTASLSVIELCIAKSDIGVASVPRMWIEVWSTGGAGTDNAQDSINNPRDDANPGDWTTSTPLKVSTFCHFVPRKVGGLAATSGRDRISLAWNAADAGGFQRYAVFRDTAPFRDVTARAPVATIADRLTTSWTDTSASIGDSYSYAVVAVNVRGDSDPHVYRWESERGLVGSGGAMDADHAGYTGDGFVDQIDGDETNDWVEHALVVPTSGYHDLAFRYAAGGAATTGRLDINGVEVSHPSMPQTASWASWDTITVSSWLNAGWNTVKFGFENGNAAFNYDRFEMVNPSARITGHAVSGTVTIEAGPSDSGVTVWLYSGTETRTLVTTDSSGAFRFESVPAGTYRIRFDADGHLPLRPESWVVLAGSDTVLGSFGPLGAGDVDGDGWITLFDAARVRAARGQAYPAADIDRSGIVDAADLAWIRRNFNRRGDAF